MYYHICGELVHTEPNIAVIDAGGVGYKLTVSTCTLGRLANIEGKAKLFTHLAVREDALELYGFYSLEELSAFKMLIGVSGVGPKAALSILSLYSPEKFALAVTSSDSKALSRAPGIGSKTAARIILELKDKIAKQIQTDIDSSSSDETSQISGSKLSEAQNALLVLGYSRSEASYALRSLDTDALSLEEIIRESLKKLMKG